MTADRLHLEDVRFYGHHGVSKAEQTVGVWFSVDAELAVAEVDFEVRRDGQFEAADVGGERCDITLVCLRCLFQGERERDRRGSGCGGRCLRPVRLCPFAVGARDQKEGKDGRAAE